MKKKKSWYRVVAPSQWRPKIGEEIEGTYIGKERRSGQFGDYHVHMVQVRHGYVKYFSGVIVDNLFAIVPTETRVKVKFLGKELVPNTERKYNKYEVFTEEELSFGLATG